MGWLGASMAEDYRDQIFSKEAIAIMSSGVRQPDARHRASPGRTPSALRLWERCAMLLRRRVLLVALSALCLGVSVRPALSSTARITLKPAAGPPDQDATTNTAPDSRKHHFGPADRDPPAAVVSEPRRADLSSQR